MSVDHRPDDAASDEIQSLPERPPTVADSDRVKGGATATQPSGPVQIAQPILKSPINPRALEPCL